MSRCMVAEGDGAGADARGGRRANEDNGYMGTVCFRELEDVGLISRKQAG